MNETEIEQLVRKAIREILSAEGMQKDASPEFSQEEELPDLRKNDLYTWVSVPSPADPQGLALFAAATPARIGVWRSGPRPRVDHWLRFRADHAAANDAVLREVSPGIVERLGLFEVSSKARSKDEHLTRPDLGRLLPEEAVERLRTDCPRGAQVQLVLADGLSAAAIEENAGLAAALSEVEIGEEIPEELYKAVAEVLVFILRLSGKVQ